MRVSIIGSGRVGACAAFALQCGGMVDEILLADVNLDLAAGEALDLLHGSTLVADQRFTSGTSAYAASGDVIVITAGLRRTPDESRLELIHRNVELFRGILSDLSRSGLRRDAIVLVVSNPVDILTQIAVETLGLAERQVMGLGTMLDSSRFSSLLAAELGLAATQVKAMVLGEHGDSQVPIWSSAAVNGLPLSKLPGFTPSLQNRIAERTRDSGAEVLRLKGGAGYAVGLAIREVVHAIALNRRVLLPVSTMQRGCYGIQGVCLSVPTVIGRQGALDRVEIELWAREKTGIENSARVLKEALGKIKR